MPNGYTEHEYEGIKVNPNDPEFDELVKEFCAIRDDILCDESADLIMEALLNSEEA